MTDVFNNLRNLITGLWSFLVNGPRIATQALGAINALSAQWSGVNIIGPVISVMITSLIFFCVFDIVRDLL